MSKMTPNRLQQATQELSKYDLQGFEVPKTISEKEKPYYVCVGVKSMTNANGMGMTYTAKTLYAMPSMWQEMEREVKSGRVKGMFNGVFNLIVILNNPTLPEVAESAPEKKIKGLSPSQKSLVNAMREEGKGENDEGLKNIAKEVGVSFERVKAYIQSF